MVEFVHFFEMWVGVFKFWYFLWNDFGWTDWWFERVIQGLKTFFNRFIEFLNFIFNFGFIRIKNLLKGGERSFENMSREFDSLYHNILYIIYFIWRKFSLVGIPQISQPSPLCSIYINFNTEILYFNY